MTRSTGKRRTVTANDILLIAGIIRDADLEDEDRNDLAVRLAEALSPMNTTFQYEQFMAWCGLGSAKPEALSVVGYAPCNERHSDGRVSYLCLRSKGHAGSHSSSIRA